MAFKISKSTHHEFHPQSISYFKTVLGSSMLYWLQVPNINIINIDLQDWDKTREEVSKIGHIDLLVNNAGVGCAFPFLDTPKEEIDRWKYIQK